MDPKVEEHAPRPRPVYLEYWSGSNRIAVSGTDIPEILLPPLEACTAHLRKTGEECGAWVSERAPRVLADAARRFVRKTGDHKTADVLADDSHMTVPMVREAAANFFPQLTEQSLHNLRERFSPPEHARPASLTPLAPTLVFHVPAGNLFVSAIESLIHTSLCGSCSLVRCPESGGEAVRLWLRCIEETDSRFAQIYAHGRWPREFNALTQAAAGAADTVVAFGSDESVAAVRNLTPLHVGFVPHGSRISFAILSEEALQGSEEELRSLASSFAYDFTVYDQQGCLSPRAAFLQTADSGLVSRWAGLLHESMRELARRLPPPVLTLEESASIARVRDHVAVESAMGSEQKLHSAPADPFLITSGPLSSWTPGCVNRHVDLRTFLTAEELGSALAPFRGRISTLGIASVPWGEQFARRMRVSRICPPGMMQKPPLGWIHDGKESLPPLLNWLGMEEKGTMDHEL